MLRQIQKFTNSFLPKIILETSSKYSENIKIIQVGKTKKLLVNGFPQSYSYPSSFAKNKVWGNISRIVYKEAKNPKNILLLGLGAGTMLHYIDEMFPTDTINITSVEIDKEIVRLSKEYFNLDKIKNNKVIIVDAYKFLENPSKFGVNEMFDCVIVDTYLGDNHTGMIGDRFLGNFETVLKDNSFILFNIVISRKEKGKVQIYKNYLSKIIQNPTVVKINCHADSDNYLYFGKVTLDHISALNKGDV